MISKKAQINKVFVYTFSVIVIIFCAYLAIKFISAFTADAQTAIENEFYNEIEKNHYGILTKYSSKKVFDYKVPSKIKYICLISKEDCIDTLDELDNLSSQTKNQTKAIYNSGDNIVLYDQNGILSSKNIGKFQVTGDCFCQKPSPTGYFKLDFENKKNDVWITQVGN